MFDMSGSAMLAALPSPGGYYSEFKIVVILVFLFPWLYACAWINRDTLRAHCPQLAWTLAILGAGAVSMLGWLMLPWYAVGLATYLAATATVITLYVVARNKRVVPDARVFTARHLSSVFSRERHQKVEVVEKIKLYDHLTRPSLPPEEEDPAALEVYNLVQNFLHELIVFHAAEADLRPAGATTEVRFVVDGVLQRQPAIDHAQAEKIIDFIKRMGGMDAQEKRHPQAGKISMQAGAVHLDATVTTAGMAHGRRMQIKIEQEVVRTSLSELGMPDDLRERVEELNAADGGLIIVSAPKGNGTTSTLYSLLRRHDAFMKQLETLEQKPAVDLENVSQHSYKGAAELPARLASALRRDPNVVMVDSCTTPEAAELMVDTAGASVPKKILLGCVADSSFQALAKWVRVVRGDPQAGMKVLSAVTNQVLLRKLCPSCKEAYTPAQNLLAKLNMLDEKIAKFYRPPTKPLTDEKGNPIVCATCRGTGYFGRTAAFELLEVTDTIRELVIQNASLSQIKAACRKNKMLYLQEQALRKVIEGITSIDEVVRVSKARNKKK